MTRTVDKLPAYLRRHCSEQDYSKYTTINQAAWRYIMRRALPFFRKNAVTGYEAGLGKTGLSIDQIPNINEMDRALQNIGWGAVPVCGFIPPWAFLEFQARKILPIATDMRTAEHIGYTPAPDIVHEAAGHAPILPDLDYSNYLSHYARLCTRAIYSDQDLRVFEAVRRLSDIKENPESSAAEILQAENELEAAKRSVTYVSEASKVARMSWWTAEYGLAGSLKNPKIYGAGLLSSVAESQNCITDAVKKIPFSIDCINYDYNITKQQPQLFVCDTMQDLLDVLDELEAMLAYRRGGVESLQLALQCGALTTTILDSTVAVSGKLVDIETTGERVDFLKWSGPVQLSSDDVQLPNQGPERHPEGFSSPVGRWEGYDNDPSRADDAALKTLGVQLGQRSTLRFKSGFVVEGIVKEIYRAEGRILTITWTDCRVTKSGKTYYQPEWGEFDMLVGTDVVGVAGGPADRNNYGEREATEQISTTPGRKHPYSAEEIRLFGLYKDIRALRDGKNYDAAALAQLKTISTTLTAAYPKEWLAMLETYELAKQRFKSSPQESWIQDIRTQIDPQKGHFDAETSELIRHGLALLDA